jgi:hypothetical protein
MPPSVRVSPPPPQCLPRLVTRTTTLPRWKAAEALVHRQASDRLCRGQHAHSQSR